MKKIKQIDITKIKFQTITREDLILSLDRLTRFKHPETKYNRVFSEIVCKYLLEPKLSKKSIEALDIEDLKKIIEKIWNESVDKQIKNKTNSQTLNKILIEEEIKTYKLSKEVENLLNINLKIDPILNLIELNEETPINLKRLKKISKHTESPTILRQQYGLRFPVEKVLLCEGITEEILLPKFAKLAKYDLDKNGVKLIGAGGKNQVAKLYCNLKNDLNIPIFILLDADAQPTAEQIKPILRKTDKIYLIKHGEFEDIFSLNVIKRTINTRFKNICECTISDFNQNQPMTKTLTEFFRTHELGDYQKAEFAKELANTLKYSTDLTDEIKEIIKAIKLL